MRQQVKIPPREEYRELVECIARGHCDGTHNIAVLREAGKTRDDLKEDVDIFRRSQLGIRDGSLIR